MILERKYIWSWNGYVKRTWWKQIKCYLHLYVDFEGSSLFNVFVSRIVIIFLRGRNTFLWQKWHCMHLSIFLKRRNEFFYWKSKAKRQKSSTYVGTLHTNELCKRLAVRKYIAVPFFNYIIPFTVLTFKCLVIFVYISIIWRKNYYVHTLK